MLVSVLVVAACAAGVVALTGGGSATSRTPDDGGIGASPSSATAQSEKHDRTHNLRFGLSYGDTLTWMTDAQLNKAMQDAKELGVHWLRVDLSWRNIQPDSPTQYLWDRFDRVVAAARAQHLEILATLSYTPRWAGDPSCARSQTCPPANNARFAEFARHAAERYASQGVHTWEIWNEPNIQKFWLTGPSIERYTGLLTATSKAIRSVDPDAYLLLGGLAAVETIPSKQYVSHKTFLEGLAREGALKQVDAISYHPYTYPLLPSTETATGTRFQDIDRTPDSLVSTLERYGEPDMPVWLTETGAPTWSGGRAADSTDAQGTSHVTPRLQAEIATDTVPAAAAKPSVGAVFWFGYRDGSPQSASDRKSQFYGLAYYDGTRKPAFEAFGKAISAYKATAK
ncbi:cellulase family glycosylhydrolase [Streptomyces chiangmaiensis]|uniref:Cellulase family glycosylhydrolase n=1 Tax=Streptomyces chiangmaiensis TaxID=766497 RepID=A0ABU7FRL3_9ACTN|nr:cellulase family glycosylhydrolase [Streptomyces chiangmaiensis]MED7826624.1 cellulase family glycosylhydrolase [Streptomyces chiangmaiensis]